MPDAGPEDERGNDERENGIDPVLAGKQNAGASGDDGGRGKRVAGHVDKGRAQVNVAGHSPEQAGDDAVHEHAGGGNNHHQARLHGDGVREPVNGFSADPERNENERGRIDEGGQNAGALVAEGPGVVCRAGLEVDRGKAEQEG